MRCLLQKRSNNAVYFIGIQMSFEKVFIEEKIVKNIWKTLTLVYSLICNKQAVKAKWFKSRSEDKN